MALHTYGSCMYSLQEQSGPEQVFSVWNTFLSLLLYTQQLTADCLQLLTLMTVHVALCPLCDNAG